MAVVDYRTEDGLATYGFSIEFQLDVGWRVYIIFEPLLEVEYDKSKLPHQAIDRYGRRYVNWPFKINSLGDARKVAALWAEHCYRHVQKLRETTVEPPDTRVPR